MESKHETAHTIARAESVEARVDAHSHVRVDPEVRKKHQIRFVSGLLGVEQDAATLALSPHFACNRPARDVGWEG